MRITVCLLVLVSCMSLASMPAVASDYVLSIFGNADMDDTIDGDDIEYVEGIIAGTNEATELADANHDGNIDEGDITRINLIIAGEEDELTLIDAADRIVTVPVPLENVVIFSSYMAEAMRAIGVNLSETIVGAYDFMVNQNPEYFPETADKPNVGGGKEINYEEIAEAKPEVVVFYPYSKVNVNEDMIEKTGAVVLYERNYDPEDLPHELRKLGMICQKEAQAEELIDWCQGYEELIVSRTSEIPLDERQSAFFYAFPCHYRGTGTYSTANKEDVNHQNLVKAGLINIAADSSVAYPKVSPEWILVENPDVIIGQIGNIAGYDSDKSVIDELEGIRDEIRNTPGISETNAAKDNRIFFVSRDILSGVNHVVAMAYMAKCVYPDLFEDIDPVEMHKEYLQFQGMEYRGVWTCPII